MPYNRSVVIEYMKKTGNWIAIAVLGIIFCVLFFSFIFRNAMATYDRGFGVDSSGKLYLGTVECIEVYENGKLIKKIAPVPRGYLLSVSENDTILVFGLRYVSEWDFDGNELSCEIVDSSVAPYYDVDITKFTTKDGVTYTLDDSFKPKIVRDDGAVLFEMSDEVFWTNLALLMGSIVAAAAIWFLLYRMGMFSVKKRTFG